MPARRFHPKFCFIFLIAVLLVSPFVGCSNGSSGSSGGGGGEIVPGLWVDIDNDSDATIGNEGVGSKQDPYDGINYALSHAAAGDAIGVADGTYLENVVMVDGVDLLGGYDSSFDVRDPDSNETVIDGDGGRSVTGANDATLDGFVIVGGGAGVFLDGVNTTVSNNVITGVETGVGLYGSNATISNNAIYATSTGIGAVNAYESEMMFPVIINNNLFDNSFAAMWLASESSYPMAPTISNNLVQDNSMAIVGYAVSYGNLLVPTISNNEISYNDENGIYLYVYHEGQIHADVIANDISQNYAGGIRGKVQSGDDHPTYTNFPALSLTAYGNDIHDNVLESEDDYGGGISLTSYGYYPSYSRIDASISNNMIRNNEGGGILELASNEYFWWYDFNPAASKINSVISNNIISSNDGPGIGVAGGGFFEGSATGGTSVNSELFNNLIMYNGYGGVMVLAAEDYGVNSVSAHSVNDVIVSNTGYGIGAESWSYSDYGLSAAMVTIDNSIVRNNTEGDLYSESYPEWEEKTGFNTNFSNIGDGDSNGDGTLDEGDLINGNISEDPLFTNFPTDLTLTAGSPSIDAGNPLPRYNDLDGTRNDQGLMGGALGGEPGPSEEAGIDPELGEPGPD